MRSATSVGCQTPTDQCSLCSRGLLFTLHFPDLHSLSCPSLLFSHSVNVWLFATLWTAAHQTSLSLTISQSLLKLMSVELVMPSNHLDLCPQSFPASGSFPMSQLFTSDGRSIGACPSYKRLSHMSCWAMTYYHWVLGTVWGCGSPGKIRAMESPMS